MTHATMMPAGRMLTHLVTSPKSFAYLAPHLSTAEQRELAEVARRIAMYYAGVLMRRGIVISTTACAVGAHYADALREAQVLPRAIAAKVGAKWHTTAAARRDGDLRVQAFVAAFTDAYSAREAARSRRKRSDG
ncbi:MAG: hypothetical protein H3C62_01065 [Gemmatimonadaceae bacterium]|nr:hypothetical protein [Gemmatimonadaceae bacterium]